MLSNLSSINLRVKEVVQIAADKYISARMRIESSVLSGIFDSEHLEFRHVEFFKNDKYQESHTFCRSLSGWSPQKNVIDKVGLEFLWEYRGLHNASPASIDEVASLYGYAVFVPQPGTRMVLC